jgi:hypothetical protein
MKKLFFLVGIALLITSSCTKEIIPENENPVVSSRANSELTIEITKADKSTITLSAEHFSVTNISNNTFSIVVNDGIEGEQSISATSAQITSIDSHLKIIKNPGVGQTIYLNKSSLVLQSTSANNISLGIQGGNISTLANSVIGEDDDGF